MADAFALEAENHAQLVPYYLNQAKTHPGSKPGRHYWADFQLVTSNYKVKLLGRGLEVPQAIPRLIDRGPEGHAEEMRLVSERERMRVDYFARLQAKYRKAAAGK